MQEENRLTQSDDLGNWGIKGLLWKNLYVGNTITEEIYEILYGCLAKLRDYEETGFNPEEIEEFKDALAAEPEWKGKRLIDANALIKVLKDRATNEAIAGYITGYDVTNSIIDEVEEQPTAYDVENVIREINDDIPHITTDDTNEIFVRYEGVINAIKKEGLEYE